MEKFIKEVRNILSGQEPSVAYKTVLLKIPQHLLKEENRNRIVNELQSLATHLYICFFFAGIRSLDFTGEIIVQDESIKDVETALNVSLEGRMSELVAVSFKERVFGEDDYELSIRWWTLKEHGDYPRVLNIDDVITNFSYSIEFGDVEEMSTKELIKLSLDADYLKSKVSTNDALALSDLRYEVNKELKLRILDELEAQNKKINLDELVQYFDEEDLYFTRQLLSFNHNNKSYVLSILWGQGENLYELKELTDKRDFIELK